MKVCAKYISHRFFFRTRLDLTCPNIFQSDSIPRLKNKMNLDIGGGYFFIHGLTSQNLHKRCSGNHKERVKSV